VELGSKVPRLRVAQRVIVSAQIACGRCRRCLSGYTAGCESVPFGASYGMGRAGNHGGGLADLIRVPFAAAMLVPLPNNVDPAQMVGLADMATDAWRAVGPALSARPGASVLVLGGAAPVIGIYSAAIAVALGAGSVYYVDMDAQRRCLWIRCMRGHRRVRSSIVRDHRRCRWQCGSAFGGTAGDLPRRYRDCRVARICRTRISNVGVIYERTHIQSRSPQLPRRARRRIACMEQLRFRSACRATEDVRLCGGLVFLDWDCRSHWPDSLARLIVGFPGGQHGN